MLFTLFTLTSLMAQEADRLLGRWSNEDKTQIVEVLKRNNVYLGKLVYINAENAKLMLDTENDEETLRNRRLLGSEVWTEFEYLEDKDMWKSGVIYNYKTGNSYNGKIQVEGNQLKLTGFYGFFFFLAKTQNWTRVSK
jgi:uncharacterized protein (DUF2147 family)